MVSSFEKFSNWIQEDIKKDRVIVNRKILSVVVWCLIFPGIFTVLLFLNRKFLIFNLDRYSDAMIFFPPLIYVFFSLWPTFRDIPRVFKKGGFVAILDDSQREVLWREKTSGKMMNELKFNEDDWQLIEFHLRRELDRVKAQNNYMTILAGAVLFLLFQFLDVGAPVEIVQPVAGAQGMVKGWVDQFAQWSFQFFSLALFTALFYLSGTQFHRGLVRYLVCVERVLKGFQLLKKN